MNDFLGSSGSTRPKTLRPLKTQAALRAER